MVILFGTVTYGQADVVKKRFSVGTEFFHIFYFPLLPVGGRLVFDQGAPKKVRQAALALQGKAEQQASPEQPAAPTGEQAPPGDEQPKGGEDAEQAQGEQEQQEEEPSFSIPMSGKSVLLGYLRGWGFGLALVCGFLGGMLWLMSRSGSDPEAAAMFPGFLWTALVGGAVAMASYYGPWNTASPKRAQTLCEAIGLDVNTLPQELRQRLVDPPGPGG